MNGRRWQVAELGYCSNVHAGESLAEVEAVLTEQVTGVRRLRQLPHLACGLWLSARAVADLRTTAARAAFRESLTAAGLHLITLNGFPFGNFHAITVKQQVYIPDWADPRRLRYTRDLARVLAACLPEGVGEATISTLPLGYRPGWTVARQQVALTALCQLAVFLDQLRQDSGCSIRVCLEPEPGCVLETSDEVIRLFVVELPRVAHQLGVRDELLRLHLGICFDVCHQAVMFEAPMLVLDALRAAGVVIGKFQLSSALTVAEPASGASRAALAEFVEPRYLHQVRTRTDDGRLRGVMDLPEALAGGVPTTSPWRIHFHVPVQTATLAATELGTTQAELRQVFDWLVVHPALKPCLEVETYTWQVLPTALRPADAVALQQGLAAELAWVAAELQQRGLLASA